MQKETALTPYINQFDDLSIRERVIIAIAVIGLIFFAWDFLYFQPYYKNNEKAQTELNTLLDKEQNLKNELNAISIAQGKGTTYEDPKLSEIQQLRDNNLYLQEQLQTLESKMLSPANMSSLLSNLLQQHDDIELVSMKTLPTEEINITSTTSALLGKGDEPDAYLHGMVLELRGSYLSVLDYVKGAEDLPWQLVWSELDYSNEAYPSAIITIKLHTYSFTRDWIGA